MKIRTVFFTIACIPCIASCGKNTKKTFAQDQYRNSLRAAATGNIQHALACIDKAIAQDKKPQHFALKATLCYQNNDFTQSKKLFEQCLKNKTLAPEYIADISNNYACTLYQMGNHTSAERIWKSLTMNPHYTSPEVAWFNLGLRAWNDYKTLQSTQLIQQASAALKIAAQRFDKALFLAPNYIDALYCKAQTEIELKQKKQAHQTLTTLLELTPEHANAKKLFTNMN